jgi:4'-phosphopantetheinyl transferase
MRSGDDQHDVGGEIRVPGHPVLAADTIQVWLVDVRRQDHDLKRYESYLSASESERVARYRFPEHANRFVIRRGTVRRLLSAYLDVHPAAVSFVENAYGKPLLAPPLDRLQFNTSHTGDWAVHGFALDHPIGIDIEAVRHDMATEEVAGKVLSPKEKELLSRLPPQERVEAFFACWTCKEAYVKALGEGLSHPLTEFSVSMDRDLDEWQLSRPNASGRQTVWHFHRLRVRDGVVGCVVVRDSHCRVRLADFDLGAEAPGR